MGCGSSTGRAQAAQPSKHVKASGTPPLDNERPALTASESHETETKVGKEAQEDKLSPGHAGQDDTKMPRSELDELLRAGGELVSRLPSAEARKLLQVIEQSDSSVAAQLREKMLEKGNTATEPTAEPSSPATEPSSQ
mmetsp:Transcript_49224/g.100512  ORF Transcript_49224/g.100512 Transcript_49224/m.100512 type:complete len:138 (+) Transcript_49224:34-447(+)